MKLFVKGNMELTKLNYN